MAKKLIVQCTNCKDWFEPRLIGGPNVAEMFQTGSLRLSGNQETCPHCGKFTLIDDSNVKVV